MPSNMKPGYITKAVAAERFDVTPRTINRWIKEYPEGTIRTHYAGGNKPGEQILTVYEADIRALTQIRDAEAASLPTAAEQNAQHEMALAEDDPKASE